MQILAATTWKELSLTHAHVSCYCCISALTNVFGGGMLVRYAKPDDVLAAHFGRGHVEPARAVDASEQVPVDVVVVSVWKRDVGINI